jgi:hypothetical protein
MRAVKNSCGFATVVPELLTKTRVPSSGSSAYRLGIDSRQDYHLAHVWGSGAALLTEDKFRRRIPSHTFATSERLGSGKRFDEASPSGPMSAQLERLPDKRSHLVYRLVYRLMTHRTDLVMTQVDEARRARDDQPKPTPDFTVEEVGGPQHVQVESDELPPRHGPLTLRGGEDAMALEDIAHRLVADRVSQMVQGALNAVIAPRAVLSCHADHQGFNRFVDAGTSNGLVWLGGVHLLVGERAVPGKDSIRPGHGGDCFQRLLAQLGAKLSEFLALAVSQLHVTVDLVAQDAIFCHEIVIAKPEVVVHRL